MGGSASWPKGCAEQGQEGPGQKGEQGPGKVALSGWEAGSLLPEASLEWEAETMLRWELKLEPGAALPSEPKLEKGPECTEEASRTRVLEPCPVTSYANVPFVAGTHKRAMLTRGVLIGVLPAFL